MLVEDLLNRQRARTAAGFPHCALFYTHSDSPVEFMRTRDSSRLVSMM